jgi:hypothetical protein
MNVSFGGQASSADSRGFECVGGTNNRLPIGTIGHDAPIGQVDDAIAASGVTWIVGDEQK